MRQFLKLVSLIGMISVKVGARTTGALELLMGIALLADTSVTTLGACFLLGNDAREECMLVASGRGCDCDPLSLLDDLT